MKIETETFLVTLCICLGLPVGAQAWNAEGHMIVAQIAYNHLDAAVKNRCDTLIALPVTYSSNYNSTFVTAACWADDIKSFTTAYSTWHYIDLPFSLDGTSTNGVVPAVFDVVQALQQNIASLQSTNATATDQATHLRFLLHFVGDIQQPLHCSTAVRSAQPGGDAGGNSFSLTGGTWSNLHSLWDAGGGYLLDSLARPLNASSQATLNNKVAAIEADYPYNSNPGLIPDPMMWATAGQALAQTNAYVGITRGTTPTQSYLAATTATTERLMAQGGHRLADLLNTIFAANPFSLVPVTRTNGGFAFSWSANAGKIYRVQWKPQLNASAWTDLATLAATNTAATFSETASTTQRYYRVLQLN